MVSDLTLNTEHNAAAQRHMTRSSAEPPDRKITVTLARGQSEQADKQGGSEQMHGHGRFQTGSQTARSKQVVSTSVRLASHVPPELRDTWRILG